MKKVSLNSLIMAFSKTFDLLDDTLHAHHWNVAYIGMRLGKELALPDESIQNIILAGLVHDIGVFKLKDRKNLVGYEDIERVGHEEIGALLLENTKVFAYLAPIVRYHHMKCKEMTEDIPDEANIVYFADRIAVSMRADETPEENYNRVLTLVNRDRDIRYKGEYIDAFKSVGQDSSFWLDLIQDNQEARIRENLDSGYTVDNYQDLLNAGQLFVSSVDFRSKFSSAHSYGVSKIATNIGTLLGLSDEACNKLEIAGFYHDIGKIAVPKEILDKPSKLSDEEFNIIKQHSYYTHEILSQVEGMEEFVDIAAHHHESLDGKGYPFGVEGNILTQLERIMAVADVFAAITEIRPYRQPLSKDDVKNILQDFADKGKLDAQIITTTIDNFDQLFEQNMSAQNDAYQRYDAFEKKTFERTGMAL